jgi:hypothetical protein
VGQLVFFATRNEDGMGHGKICGEMTEYEKKRADQSEREKSLKIRRLFLQSLQLAQPNQDHQPASPNSREDVYSMMRMMSGLEDVSQKKL